MDKTQDKNLIDRFIKPLFTRTVTFDLRTPQASSTPPKSATQPLKQGGVPEWMMGKVSENYGRYKPSIQKAYSMYPEVNRGLLESVLMKESTMGVDDRNKKANFGEYGYLGGHTTTGHYLDTIKQKKDNPNLDFAILRRDEGGMPIIPGAEDLSNEAAAITATAATLAKLKRNNPGMSDKDIYLKKYATSPEASSPESVANFDRYYQYFSGI